MKFLSTFMSLLLIVGEVVLATPSEPVDALPQTNLPKIALGLGKIVLEVPMAITPTQRTTGLMHRTVLGENEGMLFVFDLPQQVAFWMKNTYVPLSIAYINASGKILEIYDLEPLDETPQPSNSTSILYALEMPKGWFQQNDIHPGMVIQRLPRNYKMSTP